MDTVHMGKKRHHIPVLLEVDVTDARAAITKRTKGAGETVSFTGWVVECLAQAAGEHKRVHARGLRRSKLVLFDDVDVALAVYGQVTGDDSGERLPMPFVIRKANEKSLVQISDEIQTAQSFRSAAGQQWLGPSSSQPLPGQAADGNGDGDIGCHVRKVERLGYPGRHSPAPRGSGWRSPQTWHRRRPG